MHLPPHRHPQKYSCSVVTQGVSNTSFSLCQCCFSAAQRWNRDSTKAPHASFSTNPNMKRSALWESISSGAQRHLRGGPSPASAQAQRQVVNGALHGTKIALDTCEGEHVPHVLLHEACELFVFQEKGAPRRSLCRSSSQQEGTKGNETVLQL